MSEASMICPKCRTFQPRAENCRECGVVVAKLWQRDADESEARTEPGAGFWSSRQVRVGAAVAGLAVVVGLAWQLTGPWTAPSLVPQINSGFGEYLEAARDAQAMADQARERMELAVYEAETGIPSPRRTQTLLSKLDLDLDRLAAEINAVTDTGDIQVSAEDLRRPVAQCVSMTDRYFPLLRFGAKEPYPLAEPATDIIGSDEPKSPYRCESVRGVIYSQSQPRADQGASACWQRHTPRRVVLANRSKEKPAPRWVSMQWDEETDRWSIYTRADQRTVDEARLEDAPRRLDADIERMYARREDRARERITPLMARLESLRSKLTIAEGEALRRQHESDIARVERDLRKALVERRQGWLCDKAGHAALAQRAEHLGVSSGSR